MPTIFLQLTPNYYIVRSPWHAIWPPGVNRLANTLYIYFWNTSLDYYS